jgi:hypothetical protein
MTCSHKAHTIVNTDDVLTQGKASDSGYKTQFVVSTHARLRKAGMWWPTAREAATACVHVYMHRSTQLTTKVSIHVHDAQLLGQRQLRLVLALVRDLLVLPLQAVAKAHRCGSHAAPTGRPRTDPSLQLGGCASVQTLSARKSTAGSQKQEGCGEPNILPQSMNPCRGRRRNQFYCVLNAHLATRSQRNMATFTTNRLAVALRASHVLKTTSCKDDDERDTERHQQCTKWER